MSFQWVTKGFEAFRRGTFGNGGMNLYVSKKAYCREFINMTSTIMVILIWFLPIARTTMRRHHLISTIAKVKELQPCRDRGLYQVSRQI